MKDQRARQILHSLVNGADPFTGEDLAPGTVLQHADVMRAMLTGCSALDDRTARVGAPGADPEVLYARCLELGALRAGIARQARVVPEEGC